MLSSSGEDDISLNSRGVGVSDLLFGGGEVKRFQCGEEGSGYRVLRG